MAHQDYAEAHNLLASLQMLEYLSDKERRAVVFHLMDWIDDFRQVERVMSGETQGEEAESAIIRFLSHAPEHMAAAAKICLGLSIQDTFGVGVVSAVDTANEES